MRPPRRGPRPVAVALAAAAALALGAILLAVLRSPGDGAAGPSASGGGQAPGTFSGTPGEQSPVMPTEIADPVKARAQEELLERRARFRSVRQAFEEARPSPAVQARALPALKAAFAPLAGARWSAECRALLCRVEVEPATVPAGWPAALAGHAALVALADRLVDDPDGGPAAFVLVPEARTATPAGGFLADVERQLLESEEAAACLRAEGAAGELVLDLEVDGSGITYRAGGDASPALRACYTDAVNGVVGLLHVPADVRTGTRRLVVRAAPR